MKCLRSVAYGFASCFFVLGIMLVLGSCTAVDSSSSSSTPMADTAVLDLQTLHPLPPIPATSVKPLRIAVAAIISPQGTTASYTPLLNELSHALDRPVELVQRRTYSEVNDLIQSGEVDLAFICTGAYVVGQRDFDLQLVAAPQVSGDIVYHSLLIVPADSPAQSMADLRGGVFAFTDPISTSGRNYPVFLLQEELGETPEQFFARIFYTYSHDDAIRAVANGVADGAAVDSLVYAFALEREPELAQKLRVLHQSPPFGIPPIVTGANTRPQLVANLQTALLNMHTTPTGRVALQTAGIDRFVLIADQAYDSVRFLEESLQKK
jgi:phosphonate transport system substrate-binding protein